MSGYTAAAVIASAVIGAGASVYASNEASAAQAKATKKREEAAKIERDRLARIASDTKPQEEGATVEFGQADSGEAGGSYDDFLVSKSNTSQLGAGTGSGLGSKSLSTLGMGA